MTTVEGLRARKRELLERKKAEQERLERGEGDKLALAEISEELLDLNAQLRALTHGRRKRGKDTSSQAAQDRRQFDAWANQEDQAEAEQAREQLRTAAASSLDALTKTQRETLALYSGGMRQSEIAQTLGISPSSVSRNLSRARHNAAEAVTKAVEGQKIVEAGQCVDLVREDAVRLVVMTMTAKQLVYFYLYYSERLSLREIGELLGITHATICRTVKRAVLKLDRLFGGQSVVVTHPEAIDEAAYLAWLELEAHPELVPEQVKPLLSKRQKRPAEYYKQYRHKTWLPDPRTTILRPKKEHPGRLLLVLQEKAKNRVTGLLQWLESVFSGLKQIWKGVTP